MGVIEVLTNVVLLIGQGRAVAMGGWLPWAGGCHGRVVAMGRYLSVLFCRNSLHVEVLTNVVLLIGQGRVVAMGGWLPWMGGCRG